MRLIDKIKKMGSLLILSTCCLTSCNFLDVVPPEQAGLGDAVKKPESTLGFLYSCYAGIKGSSNPITYTGMEAASTDEFVFPELWGHSGQRAGWGLLTPESPGDWKWGNIYRYIGQCYLFLSQLPNALDVSEVQKREWTAEANFLIAYYHFLILEYYGPCPITDSYIDMDTPNNEYHGRYHFDYVTSWISMKLDEAAKDLPASRIGSEWGRATSTIAKAVKAQLLLLAASPLFNGNSDYINVKDNQGRHLFPTQVDNSKWKLAADAALEAINCAKENGHEKLYTFSLPINSIAAATRKLLDIGEAVTEKWNEEIIWGSTRNVNGLQTVAMAKHTKGSHYNARSVLGPTLSVAEAFYSSNGVPISEDNSDFWTANYPNRYEITTIPDEGNNKYYLQIGEQTAYLHLNREPRFYASLSFDRGTWYGDGYTNDEPANLAFYHFRAKEVSGRQTSEDHSYTGYLNKKVCSYKTGLTKDGFSPYRYSFPIIRLADLYLMYAEALNESQESPTQDVYDYVDLVRERAGLKGVKESWSKYSKSPDKPNTKNGMREIIRMERLNELACEGKRFWDLRRWKKELPREVKGWHIQGETAQEFYRVTTIYLRSKYSYKDYLWPLKLETILKDPNLVQNPGW